MFVFESGSGERDVIWAHGWGHSHQSFLPVAAGLRNNCRHLLLDLPGFGVSPVPDEPWGTIEYANLVAEWLHQLPPKPRLWVGHSFGCRVGIRLATHHPSLVSGLFLIAAAGVPPPTSAYRLALRRVRRTLFGFLKQVAWSDHLRDRLRDRFGSSDYRKAGPMRGTLVRVVNENLLEDSRKINAPARLVYGADDVVTFPSVGKVYNDAIRTSELIVLPRLDHLTILTEGRFQLQALIQDFLVYLNP